MSARVVKGSQFVHKTCLLLRLRFRENNVPITSFCPVFPLTGCRISIFDQYENIRQNVITGI